MGNLVNPEVGERAETGHRPPERTRELSDLGQSIDRILQAQERGEQLLRSEAEALLHLDLLRDWYAKPSRLHPYGLNFRIVEEGWKVKVYDSSAGAKTITLDWRQDNPGSSRGIVMEYRQTAEADEMNIRVVDTNVTVRRYASMKHNSLTMSFDKNNPDRYSFKETGFKPVPGARHRRRK